MAVTISKFTLFLMDSLNQMLACYQIIAEFKAE